MNPFGKSFNIILEESESEYVESQRNRYGMVLFDFGDRVIGVDVVKSQSELSIILGKILMGLEIMERKRNVIVV